MKYSRQKNIVARTVAGENLLVPVNQCTKKVFTLSSVGLYLWNLIETPRSEDELAEALVEKYQIEKVTAATDVRAFLDDMLRMELVVEQGVL